MAKIKVIQDIDNIKKIRNFKDGDNSQKILDAMKEKLYIDYKKAGYKITEYKETTRGDETEIFMKLVSIKKRIKNGKINRA